MLEGGCLKGGVIGWGGYFEGVLKGCVEGVVGERSCVTRSLECMCCMGVLEGCVLRGLLERGVALPGLLSVCVVWLGRCTMSPF